MDEIVYFYPEGHAAHAQLGHPERPERVECLRQSIRAAGWWDPYPKLDPLEVPKSVMDRIHSPIYVELLREASRQCEWLDMDTYTTTATCELALNSAGGALAVAEAVWERMARRGFALTRPPGHHATATRGMGFCLLNNVALAAEYLLQYKGAHRLAVVDLDLHHGNGTQEIFWQRQDVFYFSIHQVPLFPGTGSLDETGAGAGTGYTANLPLPPGSGDHAYQAALNELILPLLDRYQPEMLLLSVGFDPHWMDPLGHLLLSARVYGELVKRLAAWADGACGGRIALFLEGGYNLQAGEACGQAFVAALMNQPWVDPLGPSPRPEGKSWQNYLHQALDTWGL